jgi:NTE family protein
LVLGGGGARAFAHVGVLKVLEEEQIPIDLIVGTSAGSIVGALYADNPNARAIKELMTNIKDKDFVDISLIHILDGPITGNALEDYLLKHMEARDFKDLKINFIAVTTDLRTGRVIPISSGPIAPAVHASCALPPYFHPVSLYGYTLVDGGVSDPVPAKVAREYKPNVVIAVDIAEELSPVMPHNDIGLSMRALEITGRELGKLRAQDADLVIYPKVGHAGVFDIKNKEELFNAGAEAARKALPQIRALLGSKQRQE